MTRCNGLETDQIFREDSALKEMRFIFDRCQLFVAAHSTVRLQVATKTRDTIMDLKYPTITTELSSFLVQRSVYKSFMPSFSRKAAVLNRMTKNGASKKLALESDARAAMYKLRQNLIETP